MSRRTMFAAIYEDREAVKDALTRLENEGIDRSRISVLTSRETQGKQFAVVEKTKAPEGASTGGAIGGLAGAILGAAATAVALPGIGLIAVGPVVAALAGAGAGAAAGGLVGGLVGRGIPEHEAKLFDEEVSKGGILVGVDIDDDEQRHRVAGSLEAAGPKALNHR